MNLAIFLCLFLSQWVWAQPVGTKIVVKGQDPLHWLLRPMPVPPKAAASGNEQSSQSIQVLIHHTDRDALEVWRDVTELKNDLQFASLASDEQYLFGVFGLSQVVRLDRTPAPKGAMIADYIKSRVQLNLPQGGAVHSAVAHGKHYWLLFEPKLTVEQIKQRKEVPQDPRVIMHLFDGAWLPIPLPDAVLDLKQLQIIKRDQAFGFIGIAKDQLVMVIQENEKWITQKTPLKIQPDTQLHWLAVEEHQLVATSHKSNTQWEIQVHLLVDDQSLNIGAFTLPTDTITRWALLPIQGKVGVIAQDKQAVMRLQTLDLQGNLLAVPIVLKVNDPTDVMNHPGRMVVSFALMLAVMFMFSIWRRDPANAKVTVPEGFRIAPIGRRLLALFIDILPCGLISAAITGMSVNRMVDHWTGMATTWEQLIPGMITIALFITHTTATEVFTAKTLGKKIMGLTVCTMDGKSPDVLQIVLRNLLKILDLIAWYVLPVLVVVSAYRQRLGDVVAKTVVISKEKSDEADD